MTETSTEVPEPNEHLSPVAEQQYAIADPIRMIGDVARERDQARDVARRLAAWGYHLLAELGSHCGSCGEPYAEDLKAIRSEVDQWTEVTA